MQLKAKLLNRDEISVRLWAKGSTSKMFLSFFFSALHVLRAWIQWFCSSALPHVSVFTFKSQSCEKALCGNNVVDFHGVKVLWVFIHKTKVSKWWFLTTTFQKKKKSNDLLDCVYTQAKRHKLTTYMINRTSTYICRNHGQVQDWQAMFYFTNVLCLSWFHGLIFWSQTLW